MDAPKKFPTISLALVVVLILVDCTNSVRFSRSKSPVENCYQVDGDPDKILCVCNEQLCDEFKFDWPKNRGEKVIVQSSSDGLRFNVSSLDDLVVRQQTSTGTSGGGSVFSLFRDPDSVGTISIDLSKERQEILGFGGAFSDAAVLNMRNLSAKLEQALVEGYFGKNGLGYTFGRVPIGCSDFSARGYTYDDSEEADYNLTKWALAHEDLNYKIPIIKKAMELTEATGTRLKLFASPWTPPAWMKDNQDLVRGHLLDSPEIYSSFSEYQMKFYREYAKHGIDFWGGAIVNEPRISDLVLFALPGLQMSNDEQVKFITKYFGPALVAEGMTKDKFKLILCEDSIGFANDQLEVIQNKEVQKFASGVNYHWYLSGLLFPYSRVTELIGFAEQENYEFVMMSEACAGYLAINNPIVFGDWLRAQAYATDIIWNLKEKTAAWVDWNMALNLEAGPNYVDNHCDSPVIVDGARNQFYRQPTYYAMGQFSRFFRPGSIVVDTQSDRSNILSVAAHKKDTGHLVVSIVNTSRRSERMLVDIRTESAAQFGNSTAKKTTETFTVRPKSISTLIMKL